MTTPLTLREKMAQVVAPNLIDAVADSELILALVLADLMSPRLWTLAARLTSNREDGKNLAAEVQHLIDRHYEHVTPARIFASNGALDLAEEARRLGTDTVEYAVSRILATYEWRAARGTYLPENSDLERLRKRELPAYVYATVDEARAVRRLMGGRKHKPLGLTSCLDEAALFAAVLAAANHCALENLVFLSSPAHFSALTFAGDGGFWFYGKRSIYSAAEWRALVEETYSGDGQAAFDDRLPNIDRMTTVAGAVDLANQTTSLGREQVSMIAARLEAFFGDLPRQLSGLIRGPLRPVEELHDGRVFSALSGLNEASTVAARVQEIAQRGHPAAIRALYAFRTLDVPEPNVYLHAARQATLLRRHLPPLSTAEDAIAAVASLPGNESIFEDCGRIAMPDETLRFRTGSDRDKALLLHILLERVGGLSGAAVQCETLLTLDKSYVRFGDMLYDASSLCPAETVEGTPIIRLGD